jgi:RNA polymerase sigma-70 factor (ECF subfamily)
MDQELSFGELLLRVRRGDTAAAEVLVRRYESAIRVAVRTRLLDPGMRRHFDSLDICQSVLASFFLRAGTGQFDLEDPAQLVALLSKMAQNKLALHARWHRRAKRDLARIVDLDDRALDGPSPTPQPEQVAISRETLDRAYALMDPQVRRIADRRVEGDAWEEIALRFGGTAEGRRKQYHRAIERIAVSLELD